MSDEALNEQKFLMNWFLDNQSWVDADKKKDRGEPWRKYYKGPRDRLYRTGDLGRYLDSGDVEWYGILPSKFMMALLSRSRWDQSGLPYMYGLNRHAVRFEGWVLNQGLRIQYGTCR